MAVISTRKNSSRMYSAAYCGNTAYQLDSFNTCDNRGWRTAAKTHVITNHSENTATRSLKSITALQRMKKRLLPIVLLISISLFLTLFLGVLSSIAFAKPMTADYQYQQIVVQKGDTLWGIAAQHSSSNDINALIQTIMQHNRLNSSFIEPGQVLYLPVKS